MIDIGGNELALVPFAFVLAPFIYGRWTFAKRAKIAGVIFLLALTNWLLGYWMPDSTVQTWVALAMLVSVAGLIWFFASRHDKQEDSLP